LENNRVKYGLLGGFFVVGYILLFYFIDKPTMLSMGVYWSSLLIYLFFMYRACIAERKGYHGNLIFADALRTAFVTFLIANLVFHIFNYVLFNFVDPNLVEIQMELAKEVYPRFLDENTAKNMLRTMTKDRFEMTLSNLVFALAKGAIGGFVLALIIAAMARREAF